MTALQNDASPIVRKRAAWALGEIRANTAVAGPALQDAAANDASPFVRSLAASRADPAVVPLARRKQRPDKTEKKRAD